MYVELIENGYNMKDVQVMHPNLAGGKYYRKKGKAGNDSKLRSSGHQEFCDDCMLIAHVDLETNIEGLFCSVGPSLNIS